MRADTAAAIDRIDADQADPIPVEINTPRVRKQMSDLLHGQLAGSMPPERIAEITGALFVLMNRASAAGARPQPDPMDVAEKASGQLTAEERIARLQGRCTTLLASTQHRHLLIREVLDIIGTPGQVTG